MTVCCRCRKTSSASPSSAPPPDSVNALLGNYNGTPAAPVTVLQGIRAAVPQAEVVYARGAELVEGLVERPVAGSPGIAPPNAPAPPPLLAPPASAEEALAAARNADVVVFVGGLTSQIEGEEMRVNLPGFAGGDRTDTKLPASQQKLLEALQATGKPVVLVLTAGSALSVDWAQQHLPAILFAWYPGQRGWQRRGRRAVRRCRSRRPTAGHVLQGR